MKMKLLIIGLLVIATALMVAPVMADSATNVTGNPTSVISLSITGGVVTLTLNPQGTNPATDNSQTLTVSANGVGWTVAASDNLDYGKPSGTTGHMSESDQYQAYITSSPKTLTAVMNVTGQTMTGANGATVKLDTGGVIETGTTAVSGTTGHVQFSQIANYVDTVLTNGENYKIIVTFTGTPG